MLEKLRSLFARKRRVDDRDTDAELEAYFRKSRLQQAAWREDILRAGGAWMDCATNVAPGTYGYQVLRLEFDGLLKRETVRTGPLAFETESHYTLTDKGRQSAAMLTD